jgi:hypothetical protein
MKIKALLTIVFLGLVMGCSSSTSSDASDDSTNTSENSKDHLTYSTGIDDGLILVNSIVKFEKVVSFDVTSSFSGSISNGELQKVSDVWYSRYTATQEVELSFNLVNSDEDYNETVNFDFEIISADQFNVLTSENVPVDYALELTGLGIGISWTDPSTSSFNTTEVRRSTSIDSFGELIYSGTDEVFTDSTFEFGEVYYYHVSSSYSDGSQSVTQSLKTRVYSASLSVSGLSASTNISEVEISWTNPSDASLTNVILKRSLASENFDDATTLSEGSIISSYIDSTISEGSSYTYYVVPEYSSGLQGAPSAVQISVDRLTLLQEFSWSARGYEPLSAVLNDDVYVLNAYPLLGSGELEVYDGDVPSALSNESYRDIIAMTPYNDSLHLIAKEGFRDYYYYSFNGSTVEKHSIAVIIIGSEYLRLYVNDDGAHIYFNKVFYSVDSSGLTENANISDLSIWEMMCFQVIEDDVFFIMKNSSLDTSLYRYDLTDDSVYEVADLEELLGGSIAEAHSYNFDGRNFFLVFVRGNYTLFEYSEGTFSSIGGVNNSVADISFDDGSLMIVDSNIYLALSGYDGEVVITKYESDSWHVIKNGSDMDEAVSYQSFSYDGEKVYLHTVDESDSETTYLYEVTLD